MDETIIWETTLTVKDTKSKIHDEIEHYRSTNYAALPSALAWLSVSEAGATATLQDNCPRDGHVLISLYAIKPSGFSLTIKAIQRHVTAGRPEDTPDAKTYAIALVTAMRQTLTLLVEQFTIPDTVSNFVTWIDEYGFRRQVHYIPHRPEGPRDGQTRLLHLIGSPENSSVGGIIFYIERDPDVIPLFTAIAEPYNGLAPVRSENLEYLHEMAAAIRAQWSSTGKKEKQVQTTKIPLPEKPPIRNKNGFTWDDVMDWYFRAPRYLCIDEADLAALVGVSLRTVQRKMEQYKANYGEMPMPDTISKFA